MDDLVDLYRRKLKFPNALFTRIDHEDAIVATVYKISQPGRPDLILKICRQDDFRREAHFLRHFASNLPVPQVVQLLEEDSAVLMEYIEGSLLNISQITPTLAREIGLLLAKIHSKPAEGYGDLTDPAALSSDPRVPFTRKFEEGLEECKGHLPEKLMATCQRHFQKDVDLLLFTDGPCIIHRDFRLGNLIAANGKIRGIIDWSAARGGFSEEDFCSLVFPEGSCFDAFLSGYSTLRKVPDFQRTMAILTLSKAIGTIGFTVKRGLWESKNASLYRRHLQYIESLE